MAKRTPPDPPARPHNPTPAERDEPVSLHVEGTDPEEVLRALLSVNLEDQPACESADEQ